MKKKMVVLLGIFFLYCSRFCPSGFLTSGEGLQPRISPIIPRPRQAWWGAYFNPWTAEIEKGIRRTCQDNPVWGESLAKSKDQYDATIAECVILH